MVDSSYTTTAICVGLLTALCISLRGAVDRYFIKNLGFTSLQYNLDSYLVSVIFFFIVLTTQSIQACTFPYTLGAVLWATLFAMFSLMGTSSMSAAFSAEGSKGGPIESIGSLKALIPLVLDLAIYKVVPTYMQLLGIMFTLLGALTISCMK